MSTATLIPTTLEIPSGIGMSHETLRRNAPSVFATQPWHGMSDRYAFVPTIEVVDMLRDNGFVPTFASQSRSLVEGRTNFTKHMLRFRHVNYFGLAKTLGQEVPELVMVNSHDGTSNYEFSIGVFRLVCLNGAIVQSGDIGSIHVRHYGGDRFYDAIVDATTELSESAPDVMKSIEGWKQLQLTDRRMNSFAESAMELVPNKPIERASRLLEARRYDDRSNDVWTVMNRIQENLIKGGIDSRTATGRRSTTKPIKAVGENLRVNRALWSLTQIYADLAN